MTKKLGKEYFKKLREDSAQLYYNIPSLNWGEMVNGKYAMVDRYDFRWKYASGHTKSLTPIGMDLHAYVLNFKEECRMAGRAVSAYIGTDSQNHVSYTRFVTVICLRVEGNGVHVLVSRMDIPKIYDYRYRLLKETDITAEFARNNKNFFKENGMPLTIHADYNNMTNHKSNGVVTEAKNYMKTHGFDLYIKPNAFAASYAADYWV
jgi:predicted RNase H-related nuclease YkuK (DUF458 family)